MLERIAQLRASLCTFLVTLCICFSCACASPSTGVQRPFEDDVEFLRQHTNVIVLRAASSDARVALAPAWQGRVMTSATAGERASGFGWINRDLIASGEVQEHINAFGGEDRLWLGPEGSRFSIYFAEGVPFQAEQWFVPKALDTLPFKVVGHSDTEVTLQSEFVLPNYSGTRFEIAVERKVRVLEDSEAWARLGVASSRRLGLVAYESNNKLINVGREHWKKETGLLSIWILGMFNASPSVTVVVPLKAGTDSELGSRVTAYEAYGQIPESRLRATGTAVFFRGDARRRGKIGINPRRSLAKFGSYDTDRGALTIVQFSQPQGVSEYVNSLWGEHQAPYAGDAINSYNDGPPAPGKRSLGQFYELESSSPAAALAPGDYVEHVHRTIHLMGPESDLDRVAVAVLGVSLAEIAAALPSN